MTDVEKMLQEAGMPSDEQVIAMQAAKDKPVNTDKPLGDGIEKPEDKPTGKPEDNNTQPSAFDWSKVKDEDIFSRVTEKAGRKIESWEDLNPKTIEKEVIKTVEAELSPELANVRKFMNETGRGLNDYANANKNWEEVGEDSILREKLRIDNPNLAPEDIDFLFKDAYTIPAKLEGDDYTESEIEANDRSIRLATIARKGKVAEGKDYLNEQKSKYSTPVENSKAKLAADSEARVNAWRENSQSAVSGLQKLEHDGFDYSFKEKENFSKDASTIEGLLGRYKDEQGQLDHSKLMGTLMKGEQLDSILTSYKTHVEASVKQELLQGRVNPKGASGREGAIPDKSAVQESEDELLNSL